MGLLAIIAGTEAPPDGTLLLEPHGMEAAVTLYVDGSFTGPQILDTMGVTGALRTEISNWVTGFPRTNVDGNEVTFHRAHAYFNLLQQNAITVAQAEGLLDYTTSA